MHSRNLILNKSRDRSAYYERIKQHNLTPLWEKFAELLSTVPNIKSVPHLWNYEKIRPLILESGDLITAKEAERRVLVLENPGLEGESAITETLYAGLQLITPGEVAPSHRHTPSALRFIVEGSGAYTAVGGEKTYMEPGDLIVTPSWEWHDHGHEGAEPVVWLDVLDLPTLLKLGLVFTELYSHDRYPETRSPQTNLYRYGNNMIPVGLQPDMPRSPVFSYPYSRTREALDHLKKQTEWDPWHGLKMEYIDPTNGGSAIPTISTFIQLLPAGFQTSPYQTTEGIVFSVVEGKGRLIVGEGDKIQTLEWKAKDTFVVPCWFPHHMEIFEESVIFSASDKVIQNKMNLWRELRGNVSEVG